jgi:SAM-dependent methyltransferase
MPDDTWASGEHYETYVGRWSRLVAERFAAWLEPQAGASWLEVGCGTGALTDAVLTTEPTSVLAMDRSRAYLDSLRRRLEDRRLGVAVADAMSLPVATSSVDCLVSGLLLNFLPDPARAVAGMARVCRPGGAVAAYVWDYGEGMQLIRHFWDAAVSVDPSAVDLDEGRRFPICQPDRLADLFAAAGMTEVRSTAVTVATRFRDFDDYWTPFLGGQGPAPGYCVGLSDEARRQLRDHLRATLPLARDGSIALSARAWAVCGQAASR